MKFTEGFYAPEFEGDFDYRWMQPSARLDLDPAEHERFLELHVLSEFRDLSQTLTATSGAAEATWRLRYGWAPISLRVPPGEASVSLRANKIFPREYYATGDERALAVRVRALTLHADAQRHRNVSQQHLNLTANLDEMRGGATRLTSTPPFLGIDMYGACNVKPPCVYCEWDSAKAQEGDAVDTPFTVDTLREWGPFYENSTTLVNCSIGEPFMMRGIDTLLDAFADGGKNLELTTNGQILPDHIIRKLVGRRIKLHISLDAGTPETYAKLRNNRFEAILRNLERLVAAKGGRGRYPLLHLVFMPMRVNVHELPQAVAIAARLDADLFVLRPLNFAYESSLNWDRGGYRFEYVKELLPFDELARVSGRAAELCARAGVPVFDQLDFGGNMGLEFETLFNEGRRSVSPMATMPAESEPVAPIPAPMVEPGPAVEASATPKPSLGEVREPLCTEPWKSLYILRRGVLPCCYGAKPVGRMDEYESVWNGELMQQLRGDLADGRLHTYCLESPSCPIVRKMQEKDELPTSQAQPATPPEPIPVPLYRRMARRLKRTVGYGRRAGTRNA